MKQASIAPPNSLIVIRDSSSSAVPDDLADGLVTANAEVVLVGTRAQPDGPTVVRVASGEESNVSAGSTQYVDRFLETPSRRIVIQDVFGEHTYLSAATRSPDTRIRVWANDDFEPDDITVVVD